MTKVYRNMTCYVFNSYYLACISSAQTLNKWFTPQYNEGLKVSRCNPIIMYLLKTTTLPVDNQKSYKQIMHDKW